MNGTAAPLVSILVPAGPYSALPRVPTDPLAALWLACSHSCLYRAHLNLAAGASPQTNGATPFDTTPMGVAHLDAHPGRVCVCVCVVLAAVARGPGRGDATSAIGRRCGQDPARPRPGPRVNNVDIVPNLRRTYTHTHTRTRTRTHTYIHSACVCVCVCVYVCLCVSVYVCIGQMPADTPGLRPSC